MQLSSGAVPSQESESYITPAVDCERAASKPWHDIFMTCEIHHPHAVRHDGRLRLQNKTMKCFQAERCKAQVRLNKQLAVVTARRRPLC